MKKFERVDVGYINTPLERLNNLSDYYSDVDIYIKRDDMTGLALGGNKTRKLDYIVKYALDNNYTTLLTVGGPQTNHGRLTIAAAAKFGLKSILVCDGKAPKKAQGNLILDKMMGAEVIFIDDEGRTDEQQAIHKKEEIAKIIQEREANGEKVLDIPLGGSSAIGAYGYLQCAKEIIDQLKEMNLKIDYLFCGYGSTGTFAGLWLGAKYFGADFEVVGVPVFPTPFSTEHCANLINELADNCEIDIDCKPEQLKVIGGFENNKYAGPAYGKTNEEIREVIYQMAQQEGIICDPCYTGKTLYGMIDSIKSPEVYNKKLLFLHTGGAPAIFADPFAEDIQEEIWINNVIQK
ncbi:D-cysteine desulfhydrase [Bacilli bacterium PM5-3]|nr:D-cysteine desulfhydrase [Bacilli bacterium PM5-3]MDH6603780.1 D-cysteine desulfhydrase [Bacilli bacterium PM5-9]